MGRVGGGTSPVPASPLPWGEPEETLLTPRVCEEWPWTGTLPGVVMGLWQSC